MLNRTVYLLVFSIIFTFGLGACKAMKSDSTPTDSTNAAAGPSVESGKGGPTATDGAKPKGGGYLLPPNDGMEHNIEWIVQTHPNFGVSTLPDDLFGHCLAVESCLSDKLGIWKVSTQAKRDELKDVASLLNTNCHVKSVRLNEGIGAVRTWEKI